MDTDNFIFNFTAVSIGKKLWEDILKEDGVPSLTAVKNVMFVKYR